MERVTLPAGVDGAARQPYDAPRVERAVREILLAIGEDPDRDGLQQTPARVARAYAELFAGLWQRPEDVLTTTFDLGHDELVIQLFEKETLNKDELAAIFVPIIKRPERPVWLSSDRRLVSDIPPVLTPAERAAQNGHGSHPAPSLGGGALGPGTLGGEQF